MTLRVSSGTTKATRLPRFASSRRLSMPGGRTCRAALLALVPTAAVIAGIAYPKVDSTDQPETRAAQPTPAPAPFKLDKGDHLCIIGNTLAERMQHDGWLETF